MRFTRTTLPGVVLIDVERREDSRGFFARVFCREEFAKHGLNTRVAQLSVACNARAGTIRGMHFQFPPHAESKIVRCIRGALLDVVVDLRPESPTYLDHVATELTEENHRSVHVPERCAHGYQTLAHDTEAVYLISAFYAPDCEGGLHYGDPRLRIRWPLPVAAISSKDLAWRPWSEAGPVVEQRLMPAPATAAANMVRPFP